MVKTLALPSDLIATDICRLSSTNFVLPIQIYPGNVVQNGNRVLQWTLILRAYQNIKTLVVQCSKVMSDAAIQLVDLNQSTLTQWYVNLNNMNKYFSS